MAEFKNIFIGKKVVQQAWLGDRVQIFQSPGWETTPMTVQQVWKKSGYRYPAAIASNGDIYLIANTNTLVKINSDGNELWRKAVDTDFILTIAINGKDDVYIGTQENDIKHLSSNGDFIWVKKIFNVSDGSNGIYHICFDQQGNIYCGGQTSRVFKRDSEGAAIWSAPGNGSLAIRSMATDSKGNTYFSPSYGQIIKVDSEGNKLWETEQVTSAFANAIAIDQQGNVCVAGSGMDGVKKLAPDGSLIWRKPIRTDSGDIISVDAICLDEMSNIYCASSLSVVKISSDGTEIWRVAIKGSRNVLTDKLNNVYCAGSSLTKFIQLKQVGPNR